MCLGPPERTQSSSKSWFGNILRMSWASKKNFCSYNERKHSLDEEVNSKILRECVRHAGNTSRWSEIYGRDECTPSFMDGHLSDIFSRRYSVQILLKLWSIKVWLRLHSKKFFNFYLFLTISNPLQFLFLLLLFPCIDASNTRFYKQRFFSTQPQCCLTF